MLHNSDFMKQNGEEKDRLTKETEAESIAFTVCSALGMVYLYDDQTMKVEFNCEDVIRRALEKYGA